MSNEYKNKKLSEVARRDEKGEMHCPVCNGTQFEAVRSTGRKLMFGVASMLMSADQVQCVTCGTAFKRG